MLVSFNGGFKLTKGRFRVDGTGQHNIRARFGRAGSWDLVTISGHIITLMISGATYIGPVRRPEVP